VAGAGKRRAAPAADGAIAAAPVVADAGAVPDVPIVRATLGPAPDDADLARRIDYPAALPVTQPAYERDGKGPKHKCRDRQPD
jgi:hypothetical protein